jgi:hypothetical protein
MLVRQPIKKFITITFLFLSLVCRAESETKSLVQFKIASLQLLSSFSSYIYFEGDKRNTARLNEAKIRGDQALSNLPVPNSALSLKWQQMSDYLDSSQERQFDVNLEAGWSIVQVELDQIIEAYESILALEEVKKDIPTDNKISDLQIKMETILSRYMAFANSTMGGYGISSKGTPLKEQIELVSKDMAKLAEEDDKYKPLARKWKYIEKTLLAYNSNVAPFVVMHTYGKMREIIATY